jgi:hypothetical protein
MVKPIFVHFGNDALVLLEHQDQLRVDALSLPLGGEPFLNEDMIAGRGHHLRLDAQRTGALLSGPAKEFQDRLNAAVGSREDPDCRPAPAPIRANSDFSVSISPFAKAS